MRKLAERTTSATAEIGKVIEEIQRDTETAARTMDPRRGTKWTTAWPAPPTPPRCWSTSTGKRWIRWRGCATWPRPPTAR